MSDTAAGILPPSLLKLREQTMSIQNVNDLREAKLTLQDHIALRATSVVGTMWFFYACAIMVTIPLIVPKVMPVIQYISSGYLQLILLPLIMVAQNLQSRHSETREENDYQVNLKAEREIEVLYRHLEYQNAVLIAMMKKLEISMDEVVTATGDLTTLEMMELKIPNDLEKN